MIQKSEAQICSLSPMPGVPWGAVLAAQAAIGETAHLQNSGPSMVGLGGPVSRPKQTSTATSAVLCSSTTPDLRQGLRARAVERPRQGQGKEVTQKTCQEVQT